MTIRLRKPFAHTFIALLSLLLSGCAVMSKSDCVAGNWREAGLHDALYGHPSESRLRSRIRVCSKHGVTANKVDYLLGYRDGLPQYCAPENGFYAGSDNHTYRGICPVELEQAFLHQYIHGLRTARRELWFRYQWIDRELFDARLHHRHRDDKDAHRQAQPRIQRLSNRRDELRTKRLQINRKIARWTARLEVAGTE
jgi:hypothetical protein